MKQLKFTLLALTAVLTGCGGRQESRSEPPQTIQTIQVGKPVLLELQQEQCQVGVDILGEVQLSFWDGFRLQADLFDLSSWQSLDALSSDLVQQMLYGYDELNILGEQCSERSRPSELMDPFCRNQRQVQSPGKALRICDQAPSYRRDSIEGAALTVAARLDSIDKFFELVSSSFRLEPLSVLLFPNIQFQTSFEVRDQARISFSITDNAAWGRRGNRQATENVLYIFPMSEEYLRSRQNYPAPNFWEVPWIMAHEFGHHIFYNVMGSKTRRYFGYDFMTSHSSLDLPFHYFWRSFQSSASQQEDHQITALNEAFADLFAHYYRDGSSLEIAHLDCIFQQRDVASPTLNDGRNKSFRELSRPGSGHDACSRVISDDVHVQGAIFAHFVKVMIDKSELGPLESNSWKAEIWFAHMQRFAEILDQAVSRPREIEIWPMAVRSLLDVLTDRGFVLDYDHCLWIDQVFDRQFSGIQLMSRYLNLGC